MRFVGRLAHGQHFPIARRQSARLAALPGCRVKVRIAGALGLEIDLAAVLHPAQRECAGAVNPGVVMVMRQHPGLAASGIEREDPAVFVVGGAAQQGGLGAILAPDRHGKLDLAFRRLGGVRVFSLLRVRGGRRGLRCGRRDILTVIHPFHFARRGIENGQARVRLRVAHVGAAARVFGISAVGDPLGNRGVPGAGGFHHGGDRVLLVGRKLQLGDRLVRPERERLARVFQLAFGLRLVTPRGALADGFEELFLFLLQTLLAGGGGLLAGGRFGRRRGTAPTASAESACDAGWRRRGCTGGANVGHLLQVAGFERHDIKVAAAREIDAFAIGQKMRVGLGFGGVGDLANLAVGRVIDEEVAIAGINREPLVARNLAEGGGRLFRFRVGELARRRSVAPHHISIERRRQLVASLLPLEEDTLAVVRPADLRGLVAHQRRAAHDVVDRERELLRRPGLENEQRQPERDEGFASQDSIISQPAGWIGAMSLFCADGCATWKCDSAAGFVSGHGFSAQRMGSQRL